MSNVNIYYILKTGIRYILLLISGQGGYFELFIEEPGSERQEDEANFEPKSFLMKSHSKMHTSVSKDKATL